MLFPSSPSLQSAPTSMPALTGLTQRYGYQPEAQYSGKTLHSLQTHRLLHLLYFQSPSNLSEAHFPLNKSQVHTWGNRSTGVFRL